MASEVKKISGGSLNGAARFKGVGQTLRLYMLADYCENEDLYGCSFSFSFSLLRGKLCSKSEPTDCRFWGCEVNRLIKNLINNRLKDNYIYIYIFIYL